MAIMSDRHARPSNLHGKGWLLLIVFSLLSISLISCSGLRGGADTQKSTLPGSTVKPAQLKWCSKPQMVFRDEASIPPATGTAQVTAGTVIPAATTPAATAKAGNTPTTATTTGTTLPPPNGTPTTINDWSVFKANVGFTIFLPETLPSGTCLVSAFGTLRDPIFGGNFTIGFQLPNNDAISLSEAPLRSQNATFQCSVDTSQANNTAKESTPTSTSQAPVQLCTGVRDTTNIVFSARGTNSDLRNFFDKLRADVNWIPAS